MSVEIQSAPQPAPTLVEISLLEASQLPSALEFPELPWFFASPLFPEEFGREIFAPLGFQQEPLRQFLMRRDL